MITPRSSCLGLAALLAGCAPGADPQQPQAEPPAITNRIELSPHVEQNLGITYETATRGVLGVWQTVPGQLEVPENRRWTLRAPARARLESTAARWQMVRAGDEVARLTSPDLQHTQHEIEHAERTYERATNEAAAARERLAESAVQLAETREFERASGDRLAELKQLREGGNALLARELLEAQQLATEASRVRLEAAIAHDALVARIANVELEAHHASHKVLEGLNELSILTGMPADELMQREGAEPRWHVIQGLTVQSPADGVVVELLAAAGETVDASAPLALIYDPSELRFRGNLPEGDVGRMSAGDLVRLEFPSPHLAPIDTELNAPPPVADPETRMIHLEAVVPNDDGKLAHGLSVLAHVRVGTSAHEEVLLPSRCVVFDGLEAIVFRRDPDDSDAVIRTPVELGSRGTDRVEVLAGVLAGDQVVADGIHQLRQSGMGRTPQGGHVHADGTWHEDH